MGGCEAVGGREAVGECAKASKRVWDHHERLRHTFFSFLPLAGVSGSASAFLFFLSDMTTSAPVL